MSEVRKVRVPIEPGFFTVPEDPATPPRLLGSRCRACNEYFFPRRFVCARCLAPDTQNVELSPRGTLYTWTYVHFPLFGSKRADHAGGYGVGQIDLPEGPRVQAVLSGEQVRVPHRDGDGSRARDAAREQGRTGRRDPPLPTGRAAPMKLENVAVLGVGMTRFGVYRDRSNIDLAREAGLAALDDAGISFKEVDEAFVGYLGAPPMTGIRAMKEFGLTGLPVHARRERLGDGAGRVPRRGLGGGLRPLPDRDGARLRQDDGDVERHVARLGARRGPRLDRQRDPAGRLLLAVGDAPHARARDQARALAAIAAKNWNFGAQNPWSDRQPDHEVTVEEVLASRKIAEPVTAMMSCPVDDGAACAILATKEIARRLQPGRPLVAPIVSTLQTETYARGHTFMGPVVGPPSMTRDTARQAYEESGIDPMDVSLTLVHDAFANEELEYYELLGFCREGEAEKLIEERQTHLGGRFPFNTDGGLIARGHPGRPDRPGADLRADAPAARRGRPAPGRERAHRHGASGGRRQRLHDQHPEEGIVMATDDELRTKGREVMAKLWGERAGKGGGGPPGAQIAPEFFDLVTKFCFGGFWSRPGSTCAAAASSPSRSSRRSAATTSSRPT